MKIGAFVFLIHFLFYSECYRILAVLPFPSRSHYTFIDPLLVKLAEKGHEVILYNQFPKSTVVPNFTHYDTSSCYVSKAPPLSTEDLMYFFGDPFTSVYSFSQFLKITPQDFTNCAPLNDLLNSQEKFDLFITETFCLDIYLIFANKFQIPFITFIPNVLTTWLADRVQNPFNPAYVPDFQSGYLSRMTFFQRVVNTLAYLFSIFVYNGIITKNDEYVNKQILGNSARSIQDTIRNTSLIFINAHNSINPVIPLVPGVVQLGGLHIKSVTPLPSVCIHLPYLFF